MSVNLTKGQRISLAKEAGGPLAKVTMGLGWDAGSQEIDLDASCVLFDETGNMVDAVWFRQLKSREGSILHTGDNRTGDGDGDDEQIIVNLAAVPVGVKALVFVVNSFTGQNFSQIQNAFCRMVDQASNREIAKYDLTCGGNHTAQIMAKVYRHGGEWKMHAIGEQATGKTFQDLMPQMKAHL